MTHGNRTGDNEKEIEEATDKKLEDRKKDQERNEINS